LVHRDFHLFDHSLGSHKNCARFSGRGFWSWKRPALPLSKDQITSEYRSSGQILQSISGPFQDMQWYELQTHGKDGTTLGS